MEARPNNLNYRIRATGSTWFNEITGVILFFFIFFHVLNFRLA